ncbi:MAG: FAD-dependent oxidoreductase, partial [Eubacterium sp.]
MERYDVVIAGAGASGLMCAWQCAKRGKKVLIIEKNEIAGKKILASGNGRCNFSNQAMHVTHYHGERDAIGKVLQQFPTGKVIELFQEIGIFHRERDGYLYPYTGQAVTVRDFLVNACRRSGVQFLFDTKVSKVIHKNNTFTIYGKGGVTVQAAVFVLACGGKANKSCGGDGSGYLLARS